MASELELQIEAELAPLIAKAETGEDWAEICRLEAEMLRDGFVS